MPVLAGRLVSNFASLRNAGAQICYFLTPLYSTINFHFENDAKIVWDSQILYSFKEKFCFQILWRL